MKLNVGDYVRIENGDIGKIKEDGGELIEYCVGTLYGIDLDRNCLDREVLKSSPNIIDLIEVGDYVNGERVIYKQYKEYPNPLLDHYVVDTIRCSYRENEIKSIVTKEMYSSVEYRVKSN